MSNKFSILASIYGVLRDFAYYTLIPYISPPSYKFYFKETDITVLIPSDSLQLIDEIYTTLSYFKFYKGQPKTIVDAGAHCGLFALVGQHIFNPRLVISLEPSPLMFKYLIKNIRMNKLKNIIPLNKALWIKSKKVNFMIKGRWSGEASIISNIRDIRDITDVSYTVSTITMQDIINFMTRIINYDKIDFLKIDIEGAELPILILNNTWLDKVEHIVFEVHQSKYGIAGVKKLIKVLSDNGFNVTCCKIEFNYKKLLRKWLQLLKDNNYLLLFLYVMIKFFLGIFRRYKRFNLLIASKSKKYV